MFTIVKQIERVTLRKFLSDEVALLLRGEKSVILFDLDAISIVRELSFSNLFDLVPYHNDYILSDNDHIYQVDRMEITRIVSNHYLKSIVFGDQDILCRESGLSNPIKKFNLVEKRIMWEVEDVYHVSLCDHGIIGLPNRRRQVKLIDRFTGQIKWSIDVSEIGRQDRFGKITIGKVIDYLGIHDNLLWFSLTDYKVIAVDPEHGKIVHLVEGLPDQYKLRVDPWRNALVGMRRKRLWEIPFQTREVLTYDLSDTFKEDDINAIDFSSGPGYYYFSDAYTGFIGALDKNSLQVVWKFRIEEVDFHKIGTQLSGIYFRSNTLLITDLQGNLFIMKPI